MSIVPKGRFALASHTSRDQDGGRWYVEPTVPADGSSSKMYQHKPSIRTMCESLMGSSISNSNGVIVRVQYPALVHRVAIYNKCIRVIWSSLDPKDSTNLFTLAAHRRYVTQRGGVPLDIDFFNLALKFNLSILDWKNLAQRMPERAPIREACFRRALFGAKEDLAAAE